MKRKDELGVDIDNDYCKKHNKRGTVTLNSNIALCDECIAETLTNEDPADRTDREYPTHGTPQKRNPPR